MRKRIVALSDSHGCSGNLSNAIRQAMKKGKIDLLVFLGDGLSDFEDQVPLLKASGIPYYAVRGNNDWRSEAPQEVTFEVNGLRFLATHGHTRGVKYGFDRICYAAAEQNAQAVLYGHTHQADARVYAGVYMVNPGAVCDFRRNAVAYADMIVEENGLLKPDLVKWENE